MSRLRDFPPDVQRRMVAAAEAQGVTLPGARPKVQRTAATPRAIPAVGWLEPITIVAPLPPSLQAHGRSKHWRTADAAKREYVESLELLRVTGRLTPPPEPVKFARLSAVMVMPAVMDDDNAKYRLKPLVDWLARAGWLVDDRRTFTRWAGDPTQEITRSRAHEVRLTITPVVRHA